MATMIRISINKDIESILEDLKTEYPSLDYAEILKLGLSELHNKQKEKLYRQELERKVWAENLPFLEISPEEAESIAAGKQQIANGESSVVSADKLLDELRAQQ